MACGSIIGFIIVGICIFCMIHNDNKKAKEAERKQLRVEQKRKDKETRKPYRDIYCDPAKMEELKRKAQAGDANSQFLLGGVYALGAYEYDIAMHWVKKAAEQGHEDAIKFLAGHEAEQRRLRERNAYIKRQIEIETLVDKLKRGY